MDKATVRRVDRPEGAAQQPRRPEPDPDTSSAAAERPLPGAAEERAAVVEREPHAVTAAGLSGSRPEISDVARRDMIARAAYYRAEQRGFAPGEELEDWLAAERDVEWFLAGGSPAKGLEGV